MQGEKIRFYSLSRPDRVNREFVRATLGHVLGARFHLPGAHRPEGGHLVAEDFCGLVVAAAPDPAGDERLIEALNELGLRRVRLDYSYESAAGHTGRFLARLLDNGFSVLLHLVQPYSEARGMPGSPAEERWRTFVHDTLEQWGNRVEMVEVGSTINRKRWAGYELEGWLAAWTIAHEEVRQRGLTLLGPNVTDFEPVYNEALLSILKKRDLLPDIHTNNIFAERTIEPEAWDHKILGPRAAPMLKANLVRKTRIVTATAQRYGLERTISTNAFWTMPRINRILCDVEQKQADYLARYMVLAAASGALMRAYWGPMVSQREGIIDDGTTHYPEMEQVTYYGTAFGKPAHWRQRPAFSALRQFHRAVPGHRYAGPVGTGHGLEVHRFQGAQEQLHVAWTMNARCAVLEDLYDPEDLETAEFLDRDGTPLAEKPDLITESPLYLRWPDGRDIRVRENIAPLPGLSIATHRSGGRHYYFRDQRWRGMVFASTREEARLLLESLHPERIGDASEQKSLRRARNAIWKIADPRDPDGSSLVVKQPVRLRLNKKLQDRFKPSKARRSWNGACELLRRGIPTPAPVAWFERHDRIELIQNWYLCDFMEGDLSVRRFFSRFARGETEYRGVREEDFYRQLCDFLLDMHKRGVFFRDLSGGNIRVELREDGSPGFSLIDTGRARFSNNQATMRQRISDLTRALHKLHWPGRMRFMAMYLGALRKSFTLLYRIPFYLYDLKAGSKRRLKGK